MQNRYFVDVNVLIDYLVDDDFTRVRTNKNITNESKNFLYSILQDESNIFVISTSSLVTAFFSMTNKQKSLMFKASMLLKNLENDKDIWIISTETSQMRTEAYDYCIENNADYEDALQYFCALQNGCKAIITNDKNFPKLDIELIRSVENVRLD